MIKNFSNMFEIFKKNLKLKIILKKLSETGSVLLKV